MWPILPALAPSENWYEGLSLKWFYKVIHSLKKGFVALFLFQLECVVLSLSCLTCWAVVLDEIPPRHLHSTVAWSMLGVGCVHLNCVSWRKLFMFHKLQSLLLAVLLCQSLPSDFEVLLQVVQRW